MSLAGLAHVVRSFVTAERRSLEHVEMPLWRRLWLYRHGVLSERDAVWDLSRATVDDYLTDRQRSACNSISHPYGAGLKNKVVYHRLVGSTHGDLLPDAYGLLRDGDVVDGFGRSAGGVPDSVGVGVGDSVGGVGDSTDDFGDLDALDDVLALARDRPIVAKPVQGAKGDTVRVIDEADGRFRIDGRPVSRRALRSELTTDRDLLLEERVTGADYAAAVYPDSTNTVRIITMTDRSGDPFVAAAMHRFGTAASGRIDNWDASGLSAGIDPETGVLGQAAVPSADGFGVEWREDHPDTGTRITGTDVPSWDRVTDAVLDLAAEYSWMWPYVGWDAVVTDDDGSVAVLEGNRNPGVEGIQAHQPLLGDERARRFFERHGIV